MSRLITFGDSFTSGQKLEDEITQCWPARLGLKLDLKTINKAYPGSSNVEILAEILNFKFDKDDLVIIGWTYVERDVVFKKDTLFKLNSGRGRYINYGGNRRLSAWNDDPICKQWFNIYTDYDLGIKSGLHIHHAELFLDSLGITHYHFLSHMQSYNPFENPPRWIKKPKNLIKNLMFKKIDLALDNSHPGVQSHQRLADKLYEYIKK